MTSGTGETRAVTQDGLAVATGIVGELFPDCPDCCTSQTDGDLCGPCKRALGIVVKAMGYADSAARSGTGETRDAAKRLIRALAKRSNPPLMERKIYPSGFEEAEQIAAAGLEAFASAALARAERAEQGLRKYGWHLEGCTWRAVDQWGPAKSCTCGYSAAAGEDGAK